MTEQVSERSFFTQSLNPDSTESDLSDILDDMDDYLDEVEAFTNAGPTPPKQGKISPPVSQMKH